MTRWTVLALVGLIFVAACGSKSSEDTQTGDALSVARLSDTHYLGAPVAVQNLTVWPVFTDRPLEIGNFLTLQEAQKQKLAVVREAGGGGQQVAQVHDNNAVGAQDGDAQAPQSARETQRRDLEQLVQRLVESGQNDTQIGQLLQEIEAGLGSATVGQLVIENKGNLPILICAGTVVTGGNQDRQIGQDFVIQAKTTVPVDAFCVEHGRWSGTRNGVVTASLFAAAEYVAPKSVRLKGQYENDQSGVWQEVATVNAARASARSAAPADNYQEATVAWGVTSLAHRAGSLDLSHQLASEEAKKQDAAMGTSVREHFAAAGKDDIRLVGFAYAIDGKPVSVRTFAHKRIFEGQFGGFVRAMCVEADVARQEAKKKGGEPVTKAASADDLIAMVRTIDKAEETVSKTAAGNDNGYKKTAIGYNSSCYFRFDWKGDGKPVRVALTQDWTAK